MEKYTILNSFVDLFFPFRCVRCSVIVKKEQPLCIYCSQKLPYTHWGFNQNNLGFSQLSNFCDLEKAFSLLIFKKGNVTQQLIHHLKYKNQQKIGTLLAQKVYDLYKLSEFDGVIPVPIHPKKLKQRGYNQITTFAQTLADLNNIPIIDDKLLRLVNQETQTKKDRKTRLQSLKDNFFIQDNQLNGHFLLVDDVLTTGATLATCVNAIKSKNKAKVSVITMACVY